MDFEAFSDPFGSCLTLAVTYFRMGTPTLSSAMTRFTSEFGMGSGGSMSLWPPGKTDELIAFYDCYQLE